MSVPGGELRLKGSSVLVVVFVLVAMVKEWLVRSERVRRLVRDGDKKKWWSMTDTYTMRKGFSVSHVDVAFD